MLKLTYSLAYDKFQTITVLGDAKGLWDLWYKLSHAKQDNINDVATDIKISTLDGCTLDLNKGIIEFIRNDKNLSNLDNIL